jgi:hypothetical protein
MIAGTSEYELPRWVTRLFRPKPPPEAPPPPPVAQSTGLSSELLAYMTQVPTPKPVARPHVFTRLQAERDLVTRLAFGETIASQDDLAARWNVDKSTISRWLKRWERKRLIPKRKVVGRYKVLTKA